MCRKLILTGWVLVIRGEAEQARVIVGLFVSITFLGLNLRFQPLDNASLTTLSHLALIHLYTCVLAIKTCDQMPAAAMASALLQKASFCSSSSSHSRCLSSSWSSKPSPSPSTS
eukprot:5494105-Prymnesium_polylepis.1